MAIARIIFFISLNIESCFLQVFVAATSAHHHFKRAWFYDWFHVQVVESELVGRDGELDGFLFSRLQRYTTEVFSLFYGSGHRCHHIINI